MKGITLFIWKIYTMQITTVSLFLCASIWRKNQSIVRVLWRKNRGPVHHNCPFVSIFVSNTKWIGTTNPFSIQDTQCVTNSLFLEQIVPNTLFLERVHSI